MKEPAIYFTTDGDREAMSVVEHYGLHAARGWFCPDESP